MARLDTEDVQRPRPRRGSRGSGDHTCRRMRHIASIQICNFTPFPVRDAVTSALALPTDQASPPASGHFLDDMEVVRSKRRSRRISALSVVTLRNIQDEEGHPEGAMRERKRATSGAGTHSSFRANSGRMASLSPTMQRGGTPMSPPLADTGPFTASASGFWLHSSQSNLESVLKSRLVETMITLAASSASHEETQQPQAPSSSNAADTPDFLSDIHQPSTKPVFNVDADSYASWASISTTCVRLAVFGRLHGGQDPCASSKGKEKAEDSSERRNDDGWALFQDWSFDLNDLMPLSDDQAVSKLPYNTPIITLRPSGRKFIVNLTRPQQVEAEDPGHRSDTESDPRTAMNAPPDFTPQSSPKRANKPARNQADDPPTPSRRRRDNNKSATWQDLIKLGNLQTCIADTARSLDELMSNIDQHALADGTSTLQRRVSEHEYVVESRRSDVATVTSQVKDLRDRIRQRTEDLARRRSTLAAAVANVAADAQAQARTVHRIARDRSDLDVLQSQLLPTRKNLITTLSYIFPIDLASPEDLLFTIVSVPLPIPVAATDPAPPLSLPRHREVTEDSVATSLGYAALVVQLAAAYLGHRLVYPITYVGSRSVIKDDISAMVGPRVFPLYSKGVDTYRFEYGVFLLNKNIEMLMAERDLRALDIRHTLPNLKNLLLTLTHNDLPRATVLHHKLSSQSILSLRTNSPTPSSSASTISSASQDTTPTEQTDSSSSPTDGSPSTPSTPTLASSSASRKSKGYFGLSPLSGFLRGRYPSTASARPSVKAVVEAGEEDNTTPTASAIAAREDADDDADRITIRGAAGVADGAEAKTSAFDARAESTNGHAVSLKELVITVTPSSPAPPIIS